MPNSLVQDFPSLLPTNKVDDGLVEIIDVEKVMADIMVFSDAINDNDLKGTSKDDAKNKHVFYRHF